jgi:hypothetical protein
MIFRKRESRRVRNAFDAGAMWAAQAYCAGAFEKEEIFRAILSWQDEEPSLTAEYIMKRNLPLFRLDDIPHGVY